MQRRDRQSCGAIRANYTLRIERLGRLRDIRESRELKNLNLADIRAALTNQELALAVTWLRAEQSHIEIE